MKLIKRGNKLLFQNNNNKPTQSLDLSVNLITFQNNKITFSGTDLEIDFFIFESIEDDKGIVKNKTDFANFAELEKYLQENIFFLTNSGFISKELYGKIIENNSLFAFSDSDIDTLLPPGNLSSTIDPVSGILTLNSIKLDENFVNATGFLRIEQKDNNNNTINATIFLPDYTNYTGEIYDWANRNLIRISNHNSSIYNLNIKTGGSYNGVRTKIKKSDGSLYDSIDDIVPNQMAVLRWSYSRMRFEEQ